MKAPTSFFYMLYLFLATSSSVLADVEVSPRLEALRQHLGTERARKAVDGFWREVERTGTPLIEPLPDDPAQMLVTFLWRATPDREPHGIGVFGVFNTEPWQTGDAFARFADTDIWHRSYRMSSAARAPYMFISPEGELPERQPERTWAHMDAEGRERNYDLFLDPRNARAVDDVYFAESSRESYFEGPDARPERWIQASGDGRSGKVTTLAVNSHILGNSRDVAVYLPAGHDRNRKDSSFLLLFDGLSYLKTAQVPLMLDNMIAAGEIPPTVAVMVDNIDQAHRQMELAPNPEFHRFIVDELVPQLRRDYGVSPDPRKAVIGGASRGGLAASFIAYKHPDTFGNVLAQSAALWWGPDDAQKNSDWLAGQFESTEPLPIRFYLTAGTMESAEDMLAPTRHFRDVLAAKGYQVVYGEYAGGHTFLNWRADLPGGLQALLSESSQRVSLAIRDVTVIDPESRGVSRNHTVYIDRDKVVAVLPAGAGSRFEADETVDGRGRYLIPGLMDMHVHVRHPATREHSWSLFVANGITGVREMGSDCWEPRRERDICIDDMQRLRRQIALGEVTGPRLLAMASAPVDGYMYRDSLPKDAEPFFRPETEEEGRQLVRYVKSRGVDLLKTYKTIPRPAYSGIADEAKKLELEFSGHVPRAVDVVTASNLGQRTIEHARTVLYDCSIYGPVYREAMNRVVNQEEGARAPDDEQRLRNTLEGFDAGLCDRVMKTLKRNDTYYVPTHKTREMDARAAEPAYRNDPNVKYIDAELLEYWRKDLDQAASASPEVRELFKDFFAHGQMLTRLAYEVGVKLMIGTDANDTMVIPGFSYHDELQFYAAAGLSPMDILRAATVVPAQYLGMTDLFGGVSAGKMADLVLLDRDPLADIRNAREIHAVIVSGRVHDRTRLDSLLRDVEGKVASAP